MTDCEAVIHSCLQNLNTTPSCIQGCRGVFTRYYKTNPKIAARTWRNVIKNTTDKDQYLPLVYICNDVLQHTALNPKKYGNNYLEAFWPYLAEGFSICAREDYKRVERIVKILGDREIYSAKSSSILLDAIRRSRDGGGPVADDDSSEEEEEEARQNRKEEKLIETVGRTTVDLLIPEVKKRKVEVEKPAEEFSIDNLIGKRAKIEEKTWPEREAELTSKVKEYTRRFREVQKLDNMVGANVSINLLGSDALVAERGNAIKAAEKVDKLIAVLEECSSLSAWIYKKQKTTLLSVAGEKKQDEGETVLVTEMKEVLERVEGIWEEAKVERKVRKEKEESEQKREEEVRKRKEEEEKTLKHLDKIKKNAKDTEGKVWDPRLKMYREKGEADDSWRDH
ncbi:hypothetical protein TrCOL_g533 [Triparma columacea]|uniref:CID domain-containing protein n=1 Tax=Triparma columacea TaxID=722753 RepID=A0A9W7L6I0_9STRA|nr:hypothetical protein TrCOL_g533 [Triparma columacea]